MTKAHSRKFRGFDDDARESSRAAARRSGKSLGDWLDDAIRDSSQEDREEEEAFDGFDEDGDRLDAVARRLARPGPAKDERRRERDDYRQPRRWRDEAEDMRAAQRRPRDDGFVDEDDRPEDNSRRSRPAEPRSDRRDGQFGARRRREEPRLDPEAIVADAAAIVERRVVESERQTARALDNLAGLIKRGQRSGEGEAVKKAVAAFAQRAEESERHTARAINNLAGMLEEGQRGRETAEEGLAYLAERLGRIETRLSETPPGATVRPIRSALARLESRLDRLSGAERAADVEQALSGLDQRLAEISRRLDEDTRSREKPPVAVAADAPQPEPAPARTSFAGVSPAALEQGTRAEPPPRRPLVDAIAEITQRQRFLDETPAPAPAPAPDLWEGEPPAARFANLHASLNSLSQQLETVRQDAAERGDQQMVVMRQIEGLRREVEEMSRAVGDLAPRASVAAVENALRDLAHRVDVQRHRGVADDLLAPAERIAGELRAVIRDLDPSPIVRNLHADVQTIGRRLDAMQQPGGADAAAIEQLSAQTREIKEQLSALAARPLPIEKIETRLFDLTQRVDALAHANLGATKAAAALDMGELARSIRTIVAAETGASFNTFNRRLEQLASKFDQALLNAGGERFDELGQRIDQLGRTLSLRIDESAAQKPVDTAPLEQLVASLARKIDSALEGQPHAPGFEEIGRKLEALETRLPDPTPGFQEIGRKLEALETRLPDPTPGFEEIGRKLERIESRVADPVSAQSIARIEAMLAKPAADRQFAELAERIDFVRETLAQRLDQGGAAAPAADMSNIEELVRSLDQKIEAVLAADSKTPDLNHVQHQLEQLYQKVDRLEDPEGNPALGALLSRPIHSPQLDDISMRLERMQMALTQRAEENYRVEARQNDLAALVEDLAARMNQALDPRGDADALRALETQIGALSQRLDRNDQGGAALAGVESRIAALVAQMEETRAATTLAAEEAVRRATQDILRQANPDPGALREALERELADIRNIQDESGQRTHETLLAVHETLERVVDRLAVFEEELSDIRNTPLAAAPVAPAAEPAPVRRREEVPAPPAARAPEPAVEPRRAARIEAAEDEDLMDFLLPPGGARAQRREPDFAAPAPEDRSVRNEAVQGDFIAAARRAAQQAAIDAEAAEKAQQARRNAGAAAWAPAAGGREGVASKLGGVAAALQDRKRPLLLGLGALVLLIGAYQIARVSIQGVDAPHQDHQAVDAAPSETEAASPTPKAEAPAAEPREAAAPHVVGPTAAPAPSEPAPAARPQAPKPPVAAPGVSPPPRMIAPHVENAPLDNTPVGSIGDAAPLNPLSAPDAVGVIKSLAQQGNPAAQYELGVRLADGRGVTRDAKSAAEWFEKAAAQGLAPAQYRLGSLYEKGVGVERDYSRAKKFYQTAADAGNARAMHNLAVLLAEGGDGGKPDYEAASGWFLKAGELGVRDSQYNLAILYARGLGVTQSLSQSYLWFSAAAAQGDADAAKKRDEVAARLDSKEVAAAKALAAGFHAKEPLRSANDVLPPPGGWESVKTPNAGADAAKPATKPPQKAKVSAI